MSKVKKEAFGGMQEGDCELDLGVQRRNARIYASLVAMNLAAAPVLTVGIVQAGLFKRLRVSDLIANLPEAAYLSMAWSPIVLAWWFPQARFFRRLMGCSYCISTAMCALAASVFLANARADLIVVIVIAHALVQGCTNSINFTLNWELLRRGLSEQYRGSALAFAFGWGPGFAVIGSLGTQLLLNGGLFGWIPPEWLKLEYPYNYALIFGMCSVAMGTAACLAQQLRLPQQTKDEPRQSFNRAIFGGLKAIINHRVLMYACIAYVLVFSGNAVQVNLSLFVREAIGGYSDAFVGYQLALQYSFKMASGFFLGWLLTRTNPKAPLLVTVTMLMGAILWTLVIPGYWSLLAFGFVGAGQLFGVYYVNYPATCSAKANVRRNISLLVLLSSVVGLAPVLYGWISDMWGLRASLWAAFALLVAAALLVLLRLPARPQAPDDTPVEPGPNAPALPR